MARGNDGAGVKVAPKRPKGPRQKHIPMRLCVLCRTSRPKRDLVRLVRTPEGPVVIDPGGKKNGRGAYLCRQRICWTAAFKRKTLEHALQTAVSADDRATLLAFAETLPESLPPAEGDAADTNSTRTTTAASSSASEASGGVGAPA